MSESGDTDAVNTISLHNFYPSDEKQPDTGKTLWKQHEPAVPEVPGVMILTGQETISDAERPELFNTFQTMISAATPETQTALQLAFREQLSTVTDRQQFQDLLVTAERVAKASAEAVHVDNVSAFIGTKQEAALRDAKTFMRAFGIVGSDLTEHPEKFRITTPLSKQETSAAFSDVKVGENMQGKRAQILDDANQLAQLSRNKLGTHIMEQVRGGMARNYIEHFKGNPNGPATLEAAIAFEHKKIEQAGGSNGKQEELEKRMIVLANGQELNVMEAADLLATFEGWIAYTPSTSSKR